LGYLPNAIAGTSSAVLCTRAVDTISFKIHDEAAKEGLFLSPFYR
jgi:hypothetical protein